MLRFQRTDQEYKFPFNLRIARHARFPSGWDLTTLVLGFVAIANLFTKQIATKYGVAFTIVFFCFSTISEKHQPAQVTTRRKRAWSSSTWIIRRRSTRPACTRGPDACWWPCAITIAWST